MRVIIILIATLLSSACFALEERELEEWTESTPDEQWEKDAPQSFRGLLGGLLVGADKYVGDRERAVGLLPLFSVTYKNTVEWHGGGGGVWLYSSDDRQGRIGLAFRSRRGVKVEDDAVLVGMNERDCALEAGVSVRWRFSALSVKLDAMNEVTNHYGGESASVRLYKPLRLPGGWGVTPSVTTEWLSKDFVGYYYGVRGDEITAQRPFYNGESSLSLKAGLTATYRFDKQWSGLMGVSVTELGKGVVDSPIVNRERVGSVSVGVVWLF